jgi:hypothetical protein
MSDPPLLRLLCLDHELSRLLSCGVRIPSTSSCEIQTSAEAYNLGSAEFLMIQVLEASLPILAHP